jgi:hypothetical protein
MPAYGPSLHLPQGSIIPAFGVIAAWRAAPGAWCPCCLAGCEPGPLSILRFWPKPFAQPSSTGIDTTLPADELVQRLGIRLVRCRVPHHARPFAPSSLVGLGRIRGASNHGGERVFTFRYFQPTQAESPTSSVDFPALRCPPGQAVHGAQISIDRVAAATGLGVFPGVADAKEVLPKSFMRVRDSGLPKKST